MSTGDSVITQKITASDNAQLSLNEIAGPTLLQLSAQQFDGSSVLNGGRYTPAPYYSPSATTGGFDGHSVLGLPPSSYTATDTGTNQNNGRTWPPKGNTFFQARPAWQGTQPPPPGDYSGGPPQSPTPPGYQPQETGPINPTLPSYQPGEPGTPQRNPVIPPGYRPPAPPTVETASGGPNIWEWGAQGVGAWYAHTYKDRWAKPPVITDAVPNEASRQFLNAPVDTFDATGALIHKEGPYPAYDMASVKYENALEKHFSRVEDLLKSQKPDVRAKIEAHVLSNSTHPDLKGTRDVLSPSPTEKAEWEAAYNKVKAGRTWFADEAKDYLTEKTRISNWRDEARNLAKKNLPEVGTFKNVPPRADESIIAKFAPGSDSLKWADEYKTATDELSGAMAERLTVQGRELAADFKAGNDLRWQLGAIAADWLFDNNYYKNVKPGVYTIGGDLAQMAISMWPATDKAKIAWKIFWMAAAHFTGRSLDASAQDKA